MAQSQDPMAALESMMANVPGGSYLLTMLKNNPEAMRALASIDQNDPSSIQKSMKVLLGAFGIQGAQADAMMAQTMQMMQNPAEMQRMAAMMPGGMPGGMPGMGAMPGAGASKGAVVDVPSTPAAAAPAKRTGPAWHGVVPEAERMLDEGNDRKAFERMTTVLDDPAVDAFDPRNPEFEELSDLLGLYARAAKAQGRQVALRFSPLYSRLAMSNKAEQFQAPEANPAFTQWCVDVTKLS